MGVPSPPGDLAFSPRPRYLSRMRPPAILSRFLRRRVDPALERVIRFGVQLEVRDPIRWSLAAHRRDALRLTTAELAPRARLLGELVAARDPEAITRYDALVDEAIHHMRDLRPSDGGAVIAVCDAIDRRLYRNDPELLDDPAFPADARARGLDGLHRLNELLGTYEAFLQALMPLIEAAEERGRRPVRIHDLAAGHAGFAVFLKQRLGERILVEASDIKDEYLELGRVRARELGVDVDFFVEDALAIDGPRRRGVDILLCTQSIHHFPPGMVARMIGEAARAATTGVLFADAERSWLFCAAVGAIAALHGRSWVLAHDGMVSLRRMFYEEELGLLATLAPSVPVKARVETGTFLPAHTYVRITHVDDERRSGMAG
ncbi:MAG: methyltransferase domain-containing protein [Byssovorax sp.]